MLGTSGYLSVVAVLLYMVCQSLICMTPRPPPLFDPLKKLRSKKRKKDKEKKQHNEWDETQALAENEGGFAGDGPDSFADEDEDAFYNPDRVYDDDDDHYEYERDDNDYGYDDGYGDGGYGDEVYEGYDDDDDDDANGYDDDEEPNQSGRRLSRGQNAE